MKKKIFINRSCFWPRRNWDVLVDQFFGDLLEEFDFVLSDKPDYMLVSCDDTNMTFLNSECIRIFYNNENFHPNFQFFDYCIGFNRNLHFSDRYLYFIPCILGLKNYLNDYLFETPDRKEATTILKQKDLFCDFIYNHERPDGLRKHYLELLSQYKPVSNGGVIY